MKNLAGVKDCDKDITIELAMARIPMIDVPLDPSTEVPYTKIGKWAEFTFTRCLKYWRVEGNVPLALAEAIYNDPACRNDVRAGCHCGALPPSQLCTTICLDNNRIVMKDEKYKQCFDFGLNSEDMEKFISDKVVQEKNFVCEKFVTKYDIDTLLGLRVFVDYLDDNL